MGFIKSFFTLIIFQPLYNALIALYVIIPDFGAAIVILTIIIRLLLIPVSRKSIESQKKMQEIQPELKKIQEKYKNDKPVQGQKIMEFYKEKKINPASGCLPLIIQLVFLIALYRVFMLGLDVNGTSDLLYSFAKDPGKLNPLSLGILDLSKPHIPLAILAAALQFVQGKMMMQQKKKKEGENTEKNKTEEKEPDFATMMQQQMIYMGPVITLIIGIRFPSGLILYWIVTTIFMIIQQFLVLKKEEKAGQPTAS